MQKVLVVTLLAAGSLPAACLVLQDAARSSEGASSLKALSSQKNLRKSSAGGKPDPNTMDNVVIRRGVEELAIAKTAAVQAADSAKDASSARENLLAEQALTRSKAIYEKLEPMPPEAKAQLLVVRKNEEIAELHFNHAREVLAESKYVPEMAAEKAIEAIKGWIKEDAAASAAHSSTIDNRQDRLAAAVAAAAEPYHLALLRNQKFCVETYAKAKSAQSSAASLLADAKKVALKAQDLQGAGLGVEARQTWGQAAGMSNEAELLRQWGNKLYGQANTACGSSGGYELLEQQAAANVAMTSIMNAPMKLPPA